MHWVNRKKGLRPGESMSDIAGHLAAAIEEEFGEPVFLTGESTGGSVVLQLAVDRPELVRSLVVVAAASRLGRAGPACWRRSWPGRCARGTTAVGWPSWRPRWCCPVRCAAQRCRWRGQRGGRWPQRIRLTCWSPWTPRDTFDVTDQLHRITAPTLVIGGGKDVGYCARVDRADRRRRQGRPGAHLPRLGTQSHVHVLDHHEHDARIHARLPVSRAPTQVSQSGGRTFSRHVIAASWVARDVDRARLVSVRPGRCSPGESSRWCE